MADQNSVMYDSQICNVCKDLFLNPDHLRYFFPTIGNPQTLFHQRSLEELKAHTAIGCHFCRILFRWFNLDTNYWEGSRLGLSADDPDEVVFAVTLATSWTERQQDYAESRTSMSTLLMIDIETAKNGDNWLSFRLLAAPDDPAAYYVKDRIANPDVGSSQSFALANQWMNDCATDHPSCGADADTSVLPLRVLDLGPFGNSKDLKLYISNDQSAPYACLSYCWGPQPQSLQLTLGTLSALVERIQLAKLPQSLQDAIHVARMLGFRYLWIDSLCIIQDSLEDKMCEIGKMDQVYSGAHLTISAASSDDSASGFLNRRDPSWFFSNTDEPPICMPFLCPNGTVGSVYLTRMGVPRSERQEPLHTRSWPLQEHILSPRILMYGSEQISWVCNHNTGFNMTDEEGTLLKDGGRPNRYQLAEMNSLRIVLAEQTSITPGEARQIWAKLVEAYSIRQQSVSDDKVHAIRGIAARFQRLVGDEYIAGFWKSWLLLGLLWVRTGKIESQPRRKYPSWSWLSIDSGVIMVTQRDLAYRYQIEDPDMGMEKFNDYRAMFDVEFVGFGSDITDSLVDPFGMLPGATLHLRGYVTKVEQPDWNNMRLFHTESTLRQARSLLSSEPCMVFDAHETAQRKDGAVWALPMIRIEVIERKAEEKVVGYAVQ
ncbi:MAG: hypothetical protein Q9218_003440, partial [Villophora microphyllina]